jgi:serine/threonine protein kinase
MTAFVVSVFRHGLLSTSYYFLDMELCELNLEDYIERKWTSLIIRKVSYFTNDQPSRMRASQIWDIMQDISSGVAFIHSNKEIHRDLKPRNGRASVCDTILVLYSHTEQAWKIADFGLTVEGTSKKAHTTQYSKGTCSYRAPELIQLDDKGTYTNKVDIWAMGCILYEIVFRSKAFCRSDGGKEEGKEKLVHPHLQIYLLSTLKDLTHPNPGNRAVHPSRRGDHKKCRPRHDSSKSKKNSSKIQAKTADEDARRQIAIHIQQKLLRLGIPRSGRSPSRIPNRTLVVFDLSSVPL